MLEIPLSFAALQIKQHDNDRYLCTLFSPEPQREGLFALYAFNMEIARIRENVTEPMMGLIRLAWWREAIEELYAGKVRNHEVIKALHLLLQAVPLSQSLFMAMIDGREQDMDEAPPATIEALEAYAAATSSSLFQLALEAVGVEDAAARHAAYHVGIAWALIGYMRSIRFYAVSSRVLFPQALMEAEGISVSDIIAGKRLEKTKPISEFLVARAEMHLAEARKLGKTLPADALPVLLPATIADIFIRRIKKSRYAVFTHNLEQHKLVVQLMLLFKAWRKVL